MKCASVINSRKSFNYKDNYERETIDYRSSVEYVIETLTYTFGTNFFTVLVIIDNVTSVIITLLSLC